jgi:hypothetical protein
MRAPLWILERFGIDEAVIGDLVEQLARGRSQVWFWRQAVSALLLAIYRDLRTSPFLLLRSMVMGVLVWRTWILLWSMTGLSFNMWVGRMILDAVGLSRPMLILAVSLINVVVSAPVWFAVGWLVARGYRNRVVLPFLAVTWVFMLPHNARQIEHALTDQTLGALKAVLLVTIPINMAAFTFSVLAGAVCKKERHEIA